LSGEILASRVALCASSGPIDNTRLLIRPGRQLGIATVTFARRVSAWGEAAKWWVEVDPTSDSANHEQDVSSQLAVCVKGPWNHLVGNGKMETKAAFRSLDSIDLD